MEFNPKAIEEDDSFIVTYEVEDNKLLVNYSDGIQGCIPYSKETENALYMHVLNQLENIKPVKSTNSSAVKLCFGSIILGLVLTGAFLITSANICLIIALFSYVFGTTNGADAIVQKVINTKRNKNIKKMEEFAEKKHQENYYETMEKIYDHMHSHTIEDYEDDYDYVPTKEELTEFQNRIFGTPNDVVKEDTESFQYKY